MHHKMPDVHLWPITLWGFFCSKQIRERKTKSEIARRSCPSPPHMTFPSRKLIANGWNFNIYFHGEIAGNPKIVWEFRAWRLEVCVFFSKKNGCLFAYTAPCMLPGFQLLASGIDLLISPGEQWTNHDRELKIQVKCNRQSTRWIEKEEIAIQNKLNLQSNHKDLNFSTATAIQKQKQKKSHNPGVFLTGELRKKNSYFPLNTGCFMRALTMVETLWEKPSWKAG